MSAVFLKASNDTEFKRHVHGEACKNRQVLKFVNVLFSVTCSALQKCRAQATESVTTETPTGNCCFLRNLIKYTNSKTSSACKIYSSLQKF